jgi:hypothetical protein
MTDFSIDERVMAANLEHRQVFELTFICWSLGDRPVGREVLGDGPRRINKVYTCNESMTGSCPDEVVRGLLESQIVASMAERGERGMKGEEVRGKPETWISTVHSKYSHTTY